MLLWKLSVFARLAFRLPANEYTLVDCWGIAQEAADSELESRRIGRKPLTPKKSIDVMLTTGWYALYN